MFPNVRLLIVALSASILALSCGLAVFAAFGVNHEPFGRLAVGAAPFELLADYTSGTNTLVTWGAPLGSRFQPGVAQVGGIVSDSRSPGRAGSGGIHPLSQPIFGTVSTLVAPSPLQSKKAAPDEAAEISTAPTAVGAGRVPDKDRVAATGGAPRDAFAREAPAQNLTAPRDSARSDRADRSGQWASSNIARIATAEAPAHYVQRTEQTLVVSDAALAAAKKLQAVPEPKPLTKSWRRTPAKKTARKALRKTVRKTVKRQRVAAKDNGRKQRHIAVSVSSHADNPRFQPSFQTAPDYLQEPARIVRTADKSVKTTTARAVPSNPQSSAFKLIFQTVPDYFGSQQARVVRTAKKPGKNIPIGKAYARRRAGR